ncbi:MAG: aldehyde dehydrogenase family protein [Acidimicrobiaceae bacterium]|nr:aldehyde dehydrogenase family protein [Acidimicrobiaceae bacterium]
MTGIAEQALTTAREAFASGRTRDASWREKQLDGLVRLLEENDEALIAALHADLGKPRAEGWTTDLGTTATEISYIRKNIRKWMKSRKVRVPMVAQPGSGFIKPEPLGVILVITPWNYPISLLLNPLAAVFAAGNTAVCKPSELAPACSKLMAELIPQYVDPEAAVVVEGDVEIATELLEQKWDHIFFTGSTNVGRIVMQAAANHLTPVTLELGGKSPTIVDESADLVAAANRITWGKFLNAGQTCIAPDYVFAHENIREELVDKIKEATNEFYGSDPKTSPDYARIVSERHLNRLTGLLDDGTVVLGGSHDTADRYLEPTILLDPSADSAIMSDEIFGPILPILSFTDLQEVIGFVNARPKPLALYIFANSDNVVDEVISQTSSGGVCVNHSLLHYGVSDLGFGGVGDSGIGRYHGKSGFDQFSNMKSVLKKSFKPELSLLYPPYTEKKEKIYRKFV